jgi:hypothetical protein
MVENAFEIFFALLGGLAAWQEITALSQRRKDAK